MRISIIIIREVVHKSIKARSRFGSLLSCRKYTSSSSASISYFNSSNMSLSSQTVQMKLRNVIGVHTCQLIWNIPKSNSGYFVSPSFYATKNSIPWCVVMQSGEFGHWSHMLSIADGGVCGAIAGLTIMKTQSGRDRKTANSYFSTTQKQKTNMKKGRPTEICDFFSSLHDPRLADVTLTCQVSFIELDDVVSRIISDPQISVPSTDLYTLSASGNSDFAKLYLNETLSDVQLHVNGGNKYAAHKVILAARSEVFEAMFKHDMQENKLHYVEIKDIDEHVFLEALRFMYTGQVDNLDAMVYDLVKVADRYNIKGLKDLCGFVLHGKLSAETVVKSLLLADSYNVDNLRAPAVEFITRHSKDVIKEMNDDEWKELVTRPALVKDVLELFMIK